MTVKRFVEWVLWGSDRRFRVKRRLGIWSKGVLFGAGCYGLAWGVFTMAGHDSALVGVFSATFAGFGLAVYVLIFFLLESFLGG